MIMRALVAFRKDKRKKKWKNIYMRFKDKRAMTAFLKRAGKLGFDVKIFTHLGW